jgi:hypothetical protein
MQSKTSTEKRVFAFSREFPDQITMALKMYDHVFKQLTSIADGKIEFSDEYGVCNNRYKFRYITPSDVATFASNLIKVLETRALNPTIADLDKFSVMFVKQLMNEHGCVPIEDSSIFGLYKYTTATMTLNDLLVLTENDFYHTTVVSKFEMKARAHAIKEDFKTIADTHFSQNVKKIVESIPNIIGQTNFNCLDCTEKLAVQTYIETFILFATMFNTVIMSNMILFCTPKSTYNTTLQTSKSALPRFNSLMDSIDIEQSPDSDDDGVVTEAVKLSDDIKAVYLVLMEGTAWISKQIKKHTENRFSHIGIAFESDLKKVYSFAMGNIERENPDDKGKKVNGCVLEDMSNPEHRDINFTAYAGLVTKDAYEKMKAYAMDVRSKKTTYSAGMIVSQLFNSDSERKPVSESRTKEVCSTFVNDVLRAADISITDRNRPSPADMEHSLMTKMSQFTRVYSGTYEDYDVNDVEERIKSFANNSKTKLLAKLDKEVVTECCLLKTAGIRCNNTIPFDINMRNIVLEDMHPRFKDTLSAIRFITSDNRSPIAQLIYAYADFGEVRYGSDSGMICKMFMNNEPWCCHPTNGMGQHEEKLHSVDFHTDVNWLDKIAYGNNFYDGNYRTDAMGDNNFHPIRNSLDMLYRMYAECELKTKTELATHVLKIGKIMEGIIMHYSNGELKNWEMTRDILAVLGEIMTRSMIKLYDNHMAIIASDNMNNVDVPGYMYTESFEYVMEADENQQQQQQSSTPSSTSSQSNDNTPSIQQANPTVDKNADTFEKVKQWCVNMIRKFVTWIKGTLQKVAEKFSRNYSAQINYVVKNKALNDEIGSNPNFNPAIKNWPNFHIPLSKLQEMNITKLISDELKNEDFNQIATGAAFKKKFYPQEFASVITESYVMEAEAGKADPAPAVPGDDKKKDAPITIALRNFFLYGKINPTVDEMFNNDWKRGAVWKDLCETIENCNKAISIGIDYMSKDLEDASNQLKAKIDELNTAASDKRQEADAIEKRRDRKAVRKEADGIDEKAKKYQELLNTIQSISNEYCLNFANTMQHNVFELSYKLYCDTVKQYKISGGNLSAQAQQTSQLNQQNQAQAQTPQPQGT